MADLGLSRRSSRRVGGGDRPALANLTKGRMVVTIAHWVAMLKDSTGLPGSKHGRIMQEASPEMTTLRL